tara:strand:- start:177 stop:1841 length:1665 start_codon:yes stop_codon:yes gene_type:complete
MNEEDNLSEEGLDEIIKKRDERLLKKYRQITNPEDPKTDEKFLEEKAKNNKEKDKSLEPKTPIEETKFGANVRTGLFEAAESGQLTPILGKAAGKPGLAAGAIITTGANILDVFISPDKDGNYKFDPKIWDLLPMISSRILEGTEPKGLLREQRDLPKDKTKGLITSESVDVPLDVIEDFPSIRTIYTDGSGLNPTQKGMLRNIFNRITGKTEKDFILDPEDKSFGALIEDVEAADEYYGTPPRAFFNKRKVDKKGRMFDLAGNFDLQELARRYPGKKNQLFRREVMALAADERFTSNTFKENRNDIIEDWFDGLEEAQALYSDPNISTLKESRDLEAHHIRSIRHMAALMDGMSRKERVKFNKILWKNAMTVGHNPANIILLSSSRFNNIHKRLHDKLDEQIGIKAEKLIDKNRKYTFSEKVEIAKRMGQIISRYTYEAYEEMADYLDDLMIQAGPAANMAAEIDIAELEARLDFQIDEVRRLMNREGFADMMKAINNLPGSSVGDSPIPSDYEDIDQSLYSRTRLTRGPSKKTIERQRRFERLYGKQKNLFE